MNYHHQCCTSLFRPSVVWSTSIFIVLGYVGAGNPKSTPKMAGSEKQVIEEQEEKNKPFFNGILSKIKKAIFG